MRSINGTVKTQHQSRQNALYQMSRCKRHGIAVCHHVFLASCPLRVCDSSPAITTPTVAKEESTLNADVVSLSPENQPKIRLMVLSSLPPSHAKYVAGCGEKHARFSTLSLHNFLTSDASGKFWCPRWENQLWNGSKKLGLFSPDRCPPWAPNWVGRAIRALRFGPSPALILLCALYSCCRDIVSTWSLHHRSTPGFHNKLFIRIIKSPKTIFVGFWYGTMLVSLAIWPQINLRFPTKFLPMASLQTSTIRTFSKGWQTFQKF